MQHGVQHGAQHGALVAVDSMDQSKGKTGDHKVVEMISILACGCVVQLHLNMKHMVFTPLQTLRRLAQNREAARKSRLRKKVMHPFVCCHCFSRTKKCYNFFLFEN